MAKKKLKFRSVDKKGLKSAGGASRGVSAAEVTEYGKGTGKFFIYTHRCRSSFYDSLDKIPEKTIKFIDSTG